MAWLRCYLGIFLEGLRKAMKGLNPDSNSVPPEYEVGVSASELLTYNDWNFSSSPSVQSVA
jgi:hypothetical protein